MPKEALYFSHDYGSRNDPKINKLRIKHGMAGIGTFWVLIEYSYEQGGKLQYAMIEEISDCLRCDLTILQSVVNDFGLFELSEGLFFSNSVLERLTKRNEKSEKARLSVSSRYPKKFTNVEKNPTNVDNISTTTYTNVEEMATIKEIKEIKENIYSAFSFFNNGFEKNWNDFKEHRTKIKKPLTKKAEVLNLNELSNLSGNNKDLAIKLVEQTIKKGWQGFFPLAQNGDLFKVQTNQQDVYTEPLRKK